MAARWRIVTSGSGVLQLDTANPPIKKKENLILKTTRLFVMTALAEIVGFFLHYLSLRKSGSVWGC
ncbi:MULTISPECIES: hypothetical protein [unclassified Polaromonas]|uniref:hypothetical protein n=1 Tax=unclassified Polaromonas TaxID=2638319 RepID=UPI0018C8F972|nr:MULTISPECIES: hypothetical protein [unclassified Polaromonas]